MRASEGTKCFQIKILVKINGKSRHLKVYYFFELFGRVEGVYYCLVVKLKLEDTSLTIAENATARKTWITCARKTTSCVNALSATMTVVQPR